MKNLLMYYIIILNVVLSISSSGALLCERNSSSINLYDSKIENIDSAEVIIDKGILEIKYISKPPVCDGYLDVDGVDPWTSDWIPILQSSWRSSTFDLDANFQIFHDSKAIYLAVQIQDETPNNDPINIGNTFARDCVEIFFAMDTLDANSGSYQGGDWQIRCQRESEEGLYIDGGGIIDLLFENGFKWGVETGSEGWVFEGRFPIAVLQENSEFDGEYIKFEIGVVDNSTGTQNGRTQMIFWNSNSEEQWHNTKEFGLAKLIAEPKLEVSNKSILINSDSDSSATVIITSNTVWTATSDQTWLTINPENGDGNGKVILTVTDNPTESTRTALVTVSAIDMTPQIITVIQEGISKELDVSSNKIYLDASGSELDSIEIISNTEWAVLCNFNWINFYPTSGSGNGWVHISADINDENLQREGYLSISANSASSKLITVHQDGAFGTFELSDTSIIFPSLGSSFKLVDIKSNAQWYAIPNVAWIGVDPNHGVGDAVIKITPSENYTVFDRQTDLKVYTEDVGEKYIYINQEATDITKTVYDTLFSFPYGICMTSGIAFDGESLWISDESNYIKKYSVNGEKIDSIQHPNINNISNNMGGLTYDGNGLWLTNSESNKLVNIDKKGNILNEITLPSENFFGLTWDGHYLWLSQIFDSKIFKLDIETGVYVKTISISEDLHGIEWINGKLYGMCLNLNDDQYYDSKFVVIDTIDGSISNESNWIIPFPLDIVWDGQYLWNVGGPSNFQGEQYAGIDRVYKISLSNNTNTIDLTHNLVSFRVYPNPTSGIIEIENLPQTGAVTLDIINNIGQKIFTKEINESSISIDLSDQNNGIYLIAIDGHISKSVKLLKK